MQGKVHAALNKLEKNHDIRILYACEAGSRAWGIASPNSDYDVRFIYAHSLDWYLSIDDGKDAIDLSLEEDQLDLHGWELRKALSLLRKSNPSLLEWLQSDVLYRLHPKFVEELQGLAYKCFSPIAGLHHYLRMAEGNYRKLMQRGDTSAKFYFNILRPLLAAEYIVQYYRIPPLLFKELVESVPLEPEVSDEINNLKRWKMYGIEQEQSLEQSNSLQVLEHFFMEKIQDLKQSAKSLPAQSTDYTAELNALFRKMIKD